MYHLAASSQASKTPSHLCGIALSSVSYWFDIVGGFCSLIFLILEVVNCVLTLLVKQEVPVILKMISLLWLVWLSGLSTGL